MAEWSIARQVARLAAGEDGPASLGYDLRAICADMELHVAGCTGLELSAPAPTAELVSRADWAEMNLKSLEGMLDPVTARLEERLSFAGPLAGALRMGANATVAAEAGLVMGYLSQRVLGQYDLSLLGGEAPPRLVFVAPNLQKAVREMDVDEESFLGWVAIHELTHVFQFQGVPWLRDYLSGLMREYVAKLEVRIEHGNAGGLPALPDMSKLVAAFREGGLAALVQTGEQRELMGRINTVMSVVEGHSEVVMDSLGIRLLPQWEGLREAMSKRRASRSAPARVFERLLGFEMKMKQYELGGDFCEAVARRAGMETLRRVWDSPDALPTPEELRAPERWLERTAGRALPA